MPEATAQRPYQFMPPMSEWDRQNLRASIEATGGLLPGFEVLVDEEGRTLEGHTREDICAELGIDCTRRVVSSLTEDEKRAFVWRTNVYRRHLTLEQKRELVRMWLTWYPATSDRRLAKDLKLSHSTVARVRDGLEDNGTIDKVRRAHTPAGRVPRDPDTRTMSNHLGTVSFDFTVFYPAPSARERTRGGLPYARETEPTTWHCSDVCITEAPPENGAEVYNFVEAIAVRLREELMKRPLRTMR